MCLFIFYVIISLKFKLFSGRSPDKTRETYCAYSLGSPNKIPRVVIKRIDEKILESKNRNVRIFVADSNVENIEDVASIFLNKLKLEKEEEEEENNLENKPITHTLTSQNDSPEKDIIAADNEFMDYDSSVESEASNTSQKMSNRKCSIKLNTKFCRNIFAYNTRNSPKKHTSVKYQNMCTTPTKKPKITMINDLRFKLSSPKMAHSTDEDILNPRYDIEIDPLSIYVRTTENLMNKATASPALKSVKKAGIDAEKALSNKFAKLENSDPCSTPKKKKAPYAKNSSPNKYVKIENSSSYSTPKKTVKFADGFEEFHQTRSGRRVKAVNYTEEKKCVYFCLHN